MRDGHGWWTSHEAYTGVLARIFGNGGFLFGVLHVSFLDPLLYMAKLA